MSGALPRVGVVVPVRDGGEDLDRLARSLLLLDYPRELLEVLVVDNGSRDGATERAEATGLRVLSAPEVASSYHARNRGWRACAGEWIAFTDADCEVPPDWLRRLLAPPIPEGTGAVLGEVVALEEATPVQRLTERYGIMRHATTMPHKALPCFSTANVAIRRGLLERLGGFRENVRFFGDMELSWRMQIDAGATLLFRPEAVVRHRHRRTWKALWRHGVQHGRGVAFMRKTFPDRYRIRFGEQLSRIGGAAASPAERHPDRWRAPLFFACWYGGMLAGYLRGPARSDR